MLPKHYIVVDEVKFYATKSGELYLKDGEAVAVPEGAEADLTEVDAEDAAVDAVKAFITKSMADGKTELAKATKDAEDAVTSMFKTIGDAAKKSTLGLAELKDSKNVTIKVADVLAGLKALATGNTKAFSFELNTKADLEALTKATGVVDFTGDVVEPTRDPEITRDPVRQPFIEQIANTMNVDQGGLRYVEIVTETGAPATTAELAAIPEKDFEYEAFTAPLKKVAVINKHSVELLEDAPQLANAIQGMITEDLNIVVDDQLLDGDGTGTNLTGILSRATLLDAAAVGAQVLAGANHFDVIRIAMTKIAVAGKGKFIPTHVLLNPVDTETLDLTKDSQGRYVMPAFSAADGTRIKSALVIENVGIPAGEFLVGDFRKLKVGRNGGVRVEFTTSDGTDFAKDIMAIKAVRRLCSYVRTNDAGAFQTGVFATVKAALAS
jgi:HK97 family phage major capsid protein